MSRYTQIGLVAHQPKSHKILQENSGHFFCNLLPQVRYFCVSWELPELTAHSIPQQTPFIQRPVHGTQLEFGKLGITFLVDQNLDNYIEIFNWMKGNSPPRNPLVHKQWLDSQHSSLMGFNQRGAYSDATLLLYTTQENVNIEVTFTNLFPTFLGKLQGTSTTTDARELTCDVRFDYEDFEFVRKGTVK